MPSHDGVFGGSMSVKTTTTTTHAVHFWEGYKIEYKMESIGCEWTCRMAAGMIQRNLHVVISIRCIYSDHTEKKKSLPFFFLSRFFPFCFVVVIRVFFLFHSCRSGWKNKNKKTKTKKTKQNKKTGWFMIVFWLLFYMILLHGLCLFKEKISFYFIPFAE